MGIETVFDGGGAPYITKSYTSMPPAQVARQTIRDFFSQNPDRKIVWAFYEARPILGMARIMDGITWAGSERINIAQSITRSSGLLTFFLGKSRRMNHVSLERYLHDTDCVYLQLCHHRIDAIGIESTHRGTRIGYYDFAHNRPGASPFR